MFKWLFKKKGCAKHMNNKLEVIGIDHGWSMMKTISQVFVTGVKEITTTPALFGDVLEYEGKFYKVGTVRQEVKDTKVEDDSFYLLTLAAVAKELKRRGLAEAKVFLAVGLPLTRFGAEKNDFIKYLTKNKRVSFKYENESYHIEIDDVAVFPQCYAAVVDKIPAMAKKTLMSADPFVVSPGRIWRNLSTCCWRCSINTRTLRYSRQTLQSIGTGWRPIGKRGSTSLFPISLAEIKSTKKIW